MKGRHQHLLLVLGACASSRGLAVVSLPSGAAGSARGKEQSWRASARLLLIDFDARGMTENLKPLVFA